MLDEKLSLIPGTHRRNQRLPEAMQHRSVSAEDDVPSRPDVFLVAPWRHLTIGHQCQAHRKGRADGRRPERKVDSAVNEHGRRCDGRSPSEWPTLSPQPNRLNGAGPPKEKQHDEEDSSN